MHRTDSIYKCNEKGIEDKNTQAMSIDYSTAKAWMGKSLRMFGKFVGTSITGV